MKKIVFFLVFIFFFSGVWALTEVNRNSPNSPLTIQSVYPDSFSAGKEVPVKFSYKYLCPLSYSIDIYEDADLSNSICTKIVNGMGWIVRNTYSGIVCEKTKEYKSNVIEDVCGLSSGLKGGSYTLRVTLFDRNDKPVFFDSRVGAIKVETNKPDLEINSISFPVNAFVESNIPVKVKLKNKGLKDATSFNLSLYFSSGSGKVLLGQKKVFELKQGSVNEINFNLDSTSLFPGEYFLEAVADSDFDLDEQNENNNLFQRKILLAAPSDFPDLIISSLDYLPSVNKGEAVPVFVKVKNNGLIDVDEAFIVSVFDSFGNIIESKIVYGMNSGQEKSISFFISSFDFSGKTSLSVSVDKLNLLSEISKGNNSRSFSFDVISDKVMMAEKCYNNSDDDADGLIDEGCKADYSVKLKDYVISSLNEKVFSVFDSSLQKNKLRFSSSQIPSFFVVPFEVNVDLGENKDYSSEFSGKSFCVNVLSKNQRNELSFVFSARPGILPVSGKEISFLKFIDSYGDFYSYLWTVDGVKKILPESYASSLYSRNFSGKTSGFYFAPKILGFNSDFEITITSDCYGIDFDGDTSNDSGSLVVKIVSREEGNGIDDDDDGVVDNGFDLLLEDFYFEPDVLVKEETVRAFLAVKNNGKFVSPQVKAFFFNNKAKQENILFSAEVGSVNPGEKKIFSFDLPSSIFPEVENEIIAVLDYENAFAESDELNNTFSSVLFKYSNFVSLKINEANADKEIVSPGSTVKLSAKIKNNGFIDSADFFILVRDVLSAEIVDSAKVSSLKAGITLQGLSKKDSLGSLNGISFASKVSFDDVSSVTVHYDYVIPGDLIGDRAYDICISSDELASGIDSASCKKVFFSVSAKSDLKVNLFKPVNDLAVKLGSPVLLKLEIENKGVADAKGFAVQLYYYDKENSKKIINSISGFSLESGQTESLVLSVDFLKEINGSVFVELDPFNEIAEDNESDNIVSVNLFSFLFENCFNGLDDDLDGLINEGCPESNFVVVTDKTVKDGFVLEALQEEIVTERSQKILFYHSVFGPIAEEKITVISPSKKTFDFLTGSDGSVSFLVDEIGEYEVVSSIKSVSFITSFMVISEEQANYSFVYLIAEFFFGSPDQTNPLWIPVLLLLSFLFAAYVFSVLSRHYFSLGDFFVLKSEFRTAFSMVVSAVLFFVVLLSNKFFGLIAFFGVLVVFSVLVYLFDLRFSKKAEEKKIINIKKEQIELKEENSSQKKKGKKNGFILRL